MGNRFATHKLSDKVAIMLIHQIASEAGEWSLGFPGASCFTWDLIARKARMSVT
jgi:hypothetical protein